jgi:hypothetical protein
MVEVALQNRIPVAGRAWPWIAAGLSYRRDPVVCPISEVMSPGPRMVDLGSKSALIGAICICLRDGTTYDAERLGTMTDAA